jgi:hypothetical protein
MLRRLAIVAVVGLLSFVAPSSAMAYGHTPIGFVDSVTAGTGTLSVSGWAADPDTTAPIRVHVYAGGVFLGALTASGSRPDVAAAYGGPTSRGFSGTFVVAAGTFNVCVYAIDSFGQGSNPGIGCKTVTVTNATPRGFLDSVVMSASHATVTGWALDPDSSASLDVHAYLDGTFVGVTRADGSRPDVGAAFGLGDRHGYTIGVDVPQGAHRLCLYAINVPTGVNPAIACTTVVGGANATPIGMVDAVSTTTSSITVEGWTLDPDTNGPIAVHVYVDGAFAKASTADGNRPDVGAAFGRGSAHGFTVTVPATAGSHRVCAYAINTPVGVNPTLGCSDVQVAAPESAGAVSSPAPAPAGRTVYVGDLHVTQPGAVVDSLDIHGFLRIEAANVTVKNTIVRGRDGMTSSTALVTNTSPGLQIIDSELVASYPSAYINGFIGSHTTFVRVNIHNVIDSIHIIGDDVTVDSSWLHDNLHYDNDPTWNGGPSHDDNIQVQTGANVVVRNSVLSGAQNSAVMITQDRGPVTGFVFTHNQADNGACTINIAEKAYGPVDTTITDNTFGTGQRLDHCAVIAKTTTQAVSTITGNTFTDGRTFAVTRG